ncbi:hypothetical protein [uncultured Sneathiella sp.]|uniref:hypothetical protein n=1 Tax=uncultured Sneathiella sp. TaxID=879315 RepID=UPI0025932E6E|nr:hypothetical protein [uncultured Sneathiella sp.]
MNLLQLQRDLDQSLQAQQPERTVQPISWSRRLFNSLLSVFARSIQNRAKHHELRVLDPRALKDIGLDGFQIDTTIEERIERERRMKLRPGRHISLRR